MDSAVVVALVAAAGSLVVAVLTYVLGMQSEARRGRQAAAEVLNTRYLNPLRLQVVETAFRLDEVVKHAKDGKSEALRSVEDAREVAGKDASWFVGEGCYLASTAYLTGCLFAQLTRLRKAYSYIKLPLGSSDTELAGLVLRVNLAFLADGGIYYALQTASAGTCLAGSASRAFESSAKT